MSINIFFIENIKNTQPVMFYLYEDNNKIVGQISCYFEAALKFQAKGGSSYKLKFYSSGGTKLVLLNYLFKVY